jgi:16S rRNA (guanine527-N7)-methyltransferase
LTTALLRTALQALVAQIGLDLPASGPDALLGYLDLLQRWNATYNLTSVRDPAQMLTHHLADCLAVIAPLRSRLAGRPAARLLDVGSGGGLPGVVIAVACPWIDVVCVDTVGKKAAFVRQVASELRLPNLAVEHARVEQLRAAPFDVIASRAFSSLIDLVSLTQPLLGVDGMWMAMKGKRPDAEMEQLPPGIEVFHVEPIVVPGLSAERCLVWMRPSS